jgi:hypothetical protein
MRTKRQFTHIALKCAWICGGARSLSKNQCDLQGRVRSVPSESQDLLWPHSAVCNSSDIELGVCNNQNSNTDSREKYKHESALHAFRRSLSMRIHVITTLDLAVPPLIAAARIHFVYNT